MGLLLDYNQIIILSGVFYLIMSKRSRALNCLLAFGLGLVSAIFTYLMLSKVKTHDLVPHFIGYIVFMLLFSV